MLKVRPRKIMQTAKIKSQNNRAEVREKVKIQREVFSSPIFDL